MTISRDFYEIGGMERLCAYLPPKELGRFSIVSPNAQIATEESKILRQLVEKIITILRDSGFENVPKISTFHNTKAMREWMNSPLFQTQTMSIVTLDLSDMNPNKIPPEIKRLQSLESFKVSST